MKHDTHLIRVDLQMALAGVEWLRPCRAGVSPVRWLRER